MTDTALAMLQPCDVLYKCSCCTSVVAPQPASAKELSCSQTLLLQGTRAHGAIPLLQRLAPHLVLERPPARHGGVPPDHQGCFQQREAVQLLGVQIPG